MNEQDILIAIGFILAGLTFAFRKDKNTWKW
jgi:hypothetical protein